jgi:Xaa-Pro aminopeptidase
VNVERQPKRGTVPLADVPQEQAFPSAEYALRLRRVRDAMERQELDFLLLHGLPNICWLSGFQTPLSDWYHCLIVPRSGELLLQCCDTELAMMNGRVSRIAVVLWERMEEAGDQLAGLLEDLGASGRRIGVELRRPGLNAWTLERLRAGLPTASFVDASDLTPRLRAVKSAAEIACLREAARLTDLGMAAGVAAIREGGYDNDVIAAASDAMLRAGSEFFSIQPIVRTGRRSGVVHATGKRARVGRGDNVFMEFGGVYKRYCAPLLRTAVVGKPDARQQRLAEAALYTLERLYAAVKPGRSVAEVSREAQRGYAHLKDEIQTRGYHAYSVGISFPPVWVEHSVGIRVDADDILEPGMVFHTPRSLRVPGQVAMGFSETILVTAGGCEALTRHPRDLIVI